MSFRLMNNEQPIKIDHLNIQECPSNFFYTYDTEEELLQDLRLKVAVLEGRKMSSIFTMQHHWLIGGIAIIFFALIGIWDFFSEMFGAMS